MGLAAEPVSNGRQQTVLRRHRARAGIGQHETTRAISRLDHARRKASLADAGGLLVARHATNRQANPQNRGLGMAKIGSIIANLWQHAGGNIKQFQQRLIPLMGMDVEKAGARRIGGL